jgi:hypothetical protein
LIYPGIADARNKIKDKINRATKYRQHYYDLFNASPMSSIAYNALHIRRNDFFIQFSTSLESVNTSDKLLQQLELLINKGMFSSELPIFIATDEVDLSYFDPLRKQYKLIFSSEFNGQLNKLDQAILDQVICSKANMFVGTLHSTYSKRIEIMRGLDGKPTNDYMGINLMNDDIQRGSYPWLHRSDKRWAWNQSSYLQWTKEDVS